MTWNFFATFPALSHLARRLCGGKLSIVGTSLNSETAEIIRRARSGDGDAFRQIHQVYGGRILNFIYRMVDTREDAEDLTQNVFLIVFHELGRLQDEKRFESWIYRIARNEVYQTFRRNRGKPRLIEAGQGVDQGENPQRDLADRRSNPQEHILTQELGATIESVLTSLPPKLREVFVLAVMHDKSYSEISEIVGRSLFAVKTDIFRARSLARKALGRYLDVKG